MEFPILLLSNKILNNQPIDALITLSDYGNNDLSIGFESADGDTFIIMQLSFIKTITFSEDNGVELDYVCFRFKSHDDLAQFWDFLSKYANFKSVRSKVFDVELKSKDERSSSKQVDDVIIGIDESEAVKSKLVEIFPLKINSEKVNENNYDEYFDDNGLLKDGVNNYQIEYDTSYAFELWNKLLKVQKLEISFEDYNNNIKHWNPLLKVQWEYDSVLREFVFDLEKGISSSEYKLKTYGKLAFEVLFSNYTYRNNQTKFEQSILNIFNFVCSAYIINESESDETYTIISGKNINFREASFSLFLFIYKLYKNHYINFYK